MAAAAAWWVNTDESQAQGVALAWQSSRVVDWKDARSVGVEQQALPPPPWDFAWCPLKAPGGFSGWLAVP